MLKTVSSIANAIGALNYKGTWNASTNSPSLTSSVGTKGDYYVVSTTGSTSLDGITSWGVGDWVVFNGSVWQRVDGGTDVNGVNAYLSGLLLVGPASAGGNGFTMYPAGSGGGVYSIYNRPASGNTTNAASFQDGGVQIGNIQYTNTAVAYLTTSDYRLKENVQPMTDALAKIAALKPCTYKWKIDGSVGEGFIAHELQSVVPQCVSGEKDAIDAEGKPIYQSIDPSFLVATLTAAIQEQQIQIEQLRAEIANLKGL